MRVVNLSRRPFLNRRPVARVALLLWIVGGLLLVLDLWLYAGYLSGTTKNRERLAELDAEIGAAERALDAAGRRLQDVDLGSRNARAAFLNELIDQRTFPWSRLFDDLEDALHDDVFLSSVAPSVVEDEGRGANRARQPRVTPREARDRARRQRRGEEPQLPTPETANVETDDDVEVVEFELSGIARTDEALLEFVDALYASERFDDPFLSTEQRDERTRGVVFYLTSRYRLPRRTPQAPVAVAEAVAEAAAPGAAAEAGSVRGTGPAANADTRAAAAAPTDASTARTDPAGRQPAGEAQRIGASQVEGRGAQRTTGTAAAADPTPVAGDREQKPAPDTARPRRPAGVTGSEQPPPVRSRDREPASRPVTAEPETRTPGATKPELTEPAASATPALRRIGSLAAPTLPWGEPLPSKGVTCSQREARA